VRTKVDRMHTDPIAEQDVGEQGSALSGREVERDSRVVDVHDVGCGNVGIANSSVDNDAVRSAGTCKQRTIGRQATTLQNREQLNALIKGPKLMPLRVTRTPLVGPESSCAGIELHADRTHLSAARLR
jgi:hypothetical protein